MEKAVIYQIGRLDVNTFKNVYFKVENFKIKTSLSSFAIKTYFKTLGVDSDLILLYPISLPFNRSLLNNDRFKASCDNECFRMFSYANNEPKEYLKTPEEFFKLHPHTRECKEFLIIHSFGTYNANQKEVSLNGYYSDVVLKILIDMIRRYILDTNTKRFIIDISSGHNIYVNAMLEATRFFSVWLKLYGWRKNTTIVTIAFSEPIIPGLENVEHDIYMEKIDAKAIFFITCKIF